MDEAKSFVRSQNGELRDAVRIFPEVIAAGQER